MQVGSLQSDLESSQMSELQLSQRIEQLESTVHQLQAECNFQSTASRDICSDETESDIIQDLKTENVNTKFQLAFCL